MSVDQFCRHDPITAKAGESVRAAAKRMEKMNVGSLAIVDEKGLPVGMVTDRDIVERVVRRRKDPDTVQLHEIMSVDVVSIWREMPLDRAFHRMRQEGVRRVMITDDEGKLNGILTYDDALPQLARRFGLAASVVASQYPDPDTPK